MKSILTFCMICLIFGGQAQILKKTYYDYQKTKPDEVYYVNAQGQKNGLYTKYTYDGAKSVEVTFVNGVFNGPGKEYYTRGGVSKLKLSGSYKNNEKHGQFITYTYVKYGQSYFNIMQNFAFNDKEADIFNTGVQTKHLEEFFDNGLLKKEISYYPSGKTAHIKHFLDGILSGEYISYSPDNQQVINGVISNKGRMIGTWIIPRENNGDCPKDKSDFSKVTYTQKIKFDDYGNIDTNYFSKTYYLSGKLRDSVRVLKVKYQGEYDSKGIWYLCGPNTVITGPYQSFYESGKVQTQGQYTVENGKSIKVGIWKTFDESGNLVNEINEDEIRNKAAEAKKEAERIEKEKIEKERIANEEKIAKENREKAEVNILIEKTDSLVKNVYNSFEKLETLLEKKTTYWVAPKTRHIVENTNEGPAYITAINMNLFYPFYQIQFSFKQKEQNLMKNYKEILKKVEEAKLYRTKLDFDELSSRKNIYTELLILAQKHETLNTKMINLLEVKTKNLEKQLSTTSKVDDIINVLENYQFEPK